MTLILRHETLGSSPEGSPEMFMPPLAWLQLLSLTCDFGDLGQCGTFNTGSVSLFKNIYLFGCEESFYFILLFNFTILYWFCHISTWIRHRYTCVPHPEPSSLLPPHIIPLGRPGALAASIQYRASNLDSHLVSYIYSGKESACQCRRRKRLGWGRSCV